MIGRISPLHWAKPRNTATGSMDPFRGPEIQPGDDQTSDEQIDTFIRDNAESLSSLWDGAGRAADDPGAVVDPECRVIGVDGLRVIDSSIFRITNGNLNAPSIMTGEKAADHILGRQPLARANDVPFAHQIGKPVRGESLVVMRSV